MQQILVAFIGKYGINICQTLLQKLFGEDYARYKHLFEAGQFLFFTAIIKERGFEKDVSKKNFILSPTSAMYLREAYSKVINSVKITLNIYDATANSAELIRDWVELSNEKCQKEGRGTGSKKLIISITDGNHEFSSDFSSVELKVDPETFIATQPSAILCDIQLLNDYKK